MELFDQTNGEVALLRAVSEGDPTAVRTMIDEHLPPVYGYVLARVGGNEAVAEDIMQETLIEGVRSAASFRGEAALSTWLITIARRRIARHWERERRNEEVVRAFEPIPSEPHVVIDLRDEVLRALGSLAPLHRQVLVLKYLDDYSVEQIAQEIDRPRVQVQSLLQRARTALRRSLEPTHG